jgi:hypothetical protein
MSNVGQARTAAEIQKDWDENPRWTNVKRDYTADWDPSCVNAGNMPFPLVVRSLDRGTHLLEFARNTGCR